MSASDVVSVWHDSNTYEMEWPPRSGTVQTFPEIDRVEWFDLDEARRRLKAAQAPFLDRLQATLLLREPLSARRCPALVVRSPGHSAGYYLITTTKFRSRLQVSVSGGRTRILAPNGVSPGMA
jgi:hypothetical protein